MIDLKILHRHEMFHVVQEASGNQLHSTRDILQPQAEPSVGFPTPEGALANA